MNAGEGAGVIGGMIQASEYLHPIWEGLERSDVEQFHEIWSEKLNDDEPESATDQIVQSISSHPGLGPAWHDLEQSSKDARKHAIMCIATDVWGTSSADSFR